MDKIIEKIIDRQMDNARKVHELLVMAKFPKQQ